MFFSIKYDFKRWSKWKIYGCDFNQNQILIKLNIQKAFENLDNKIVLDKMKRIGFSDKAIKSFHSYLTNRAFFVSLGTIPKDLYWDLCCFVVHK